MGGVQASGRPERSRVPRRLTRAAAAVALTLSACAQTGVAELRDPLGLVEASRFRFNVQQGPATGVDVVEGSDPWDVRIRWIAMPCQDRPQVEVAAADDDRLSITIDAGPRGNCESMGVAHGVDLRFSRPVRVTDVVASLKD